MREIQNMTSQTSQKSCDPLVEHAKWGLVRLWFVALLLVVLSVTARIGAAQDQQKRPAATNDQATIKQDDGDQTSRDNSIRVMSFNIRYGTANDGKNRWPLRRELVLKTIQTFNPDLLGTQETLPLQANFLKQSLPSHTYFGRTRNAKPDGFGEACGLLYRTERFEALAQGHFWLSETPDVPGSRSWDSSLPRMATWVRLWDRQTERSIYFLNTHFDHRGSKARLEGARLVRAWANRLPTDSHVVITGDFNSAVNSAPYKMLFANSASSALIDTFNNARSRERLADPSRHNVDPAKRSGEEIVENGTGTFNGFRGKSDGARIDWIGVSENWQIESANIDRTNENGRYPSDHFPVTTVLKFNATTSTPNK